MYVLSPLIPAWKAISISLKTPKPPCAVIKQPGRSLEKLPAFLAFNDLKSQLWPVMALTDMAIFGCSRLEFSFFYLHAVVRRSLSLLSDSPALLAVQMRSPAQCHWDLPDTPKIIKSVTDIHVTPGLRHLYCYTFLVSLILEKVSCHSISFLCCIQYPNLSWDPQLWDWQDAGTSGLFVQIGW